MFSCSCILPLEPASVPLDAPQAMAKLPEVQAAMEAYFLAHKDQAAVGLELLPGVKELLAALQVR